MPNLCQLLIALILSFHINFIYSFSSSDSFSESLRIKSLPSGHIYTYFQFKIIDNELKRHSRLFPRALSEILVTHSVEELEFSLTQGYWNLGTWGESELGAPGGAQVISWFRSSSEKAASENWKGLTSRLSGLTCASLNFLDERNSISPAFAFRPEGQINSSSLNNNELFVRVGVLPKENICTENLTPWSKLLPCGLSHGLASLLRTKKVFNTHYHSASIKFIKTSEGVELKLALSLVFDPLEPSDKFSRGIFGTIANLPCEPSSKTSVEIWNHGKKLWVPLALNLLNSFKMEEISRGGRENLDLVFTPTKFLGGYGQEYGEMIIEMVNHLKEQSISVLYVEVLPWYIRPYLHTMKINLKSPTNITSHQAQLFDYKPARDREALHKLEISFEIPPSSTILLRFQIEKRHLKWDEYPPDANHGFYLQSAHFEVRLLNKNNINENEAKIYHYYSRKLLVNLSTPDFSMPYNVICLTCTVVALAFGPLHNITTKHLVLKPTVSKMSKIRGALKKILGNLFKKAKETSENVNKIEKSGGSESIGVVNESSDGISENVSR